MIGGLSACGSATVVPLRLRSRRLCASASLSRSPNRRPKHIMIGLGEKSVLKVSVKPVAF
jgi:hypothetical protein